MQTLLFELGSLLPITFHLSENEKFQWDGTKWKLSWLIGYRFWMGQFGANYLTGEIKNKLKDDILYWAVAWAHIGRHTQRRLKVFPPIIQLRRWFTFNSILFFTITYHIHPRFHSAVLNSSWESFHWMTFLFPCCPHHNISVNKLLYFWRLTLYIVDPSDMIWLIWPCQLATYMIQLPSSYHCHGSLNGWLTDWWARSLKSSETVIIFV